MAELQTFRDYQICQDRKGGTVEVWRSSDEVACLAFDGKTQRFVELHVALQGQEGADVRRFQRLVDEAVLVRHRHVLQVLEGGEDEGANFYVTAFLDGERLDTWLARCNPLPPWLALQVTQQLADGLCALADHPRLLAGVEVFHAAVGLSGEHTDDLRVKVCDLGLTGPEPALREPREIEAHAIQATGRLLLYMLTGTLSDGPVTADLLTSSHVAPELGFLLGTIFQPNAPHHPRTVAQLRTLIERCARDLSPELLARPDRLPANVRPRLPLQAHFLMPSAVAEAVHDDYTVDVRAFDAQVPYQLRATRRSTREPAVVQVLPPGHLLPSEELATALDRVLTDFPKGGSPHLLRLLEWNAGAHPDVLVEEAPGRWSLESAVRLRGRLEPAEVRLVLTRLLEAVHAADHAGLTPVWQYPGGVTLAFAESEDSLPPESALARLPLAEWPEFRLKLRTWPVALQFTQPERYQVECLVAREPGGAEVRPPRPTRSGLPGGRDCALLAVWMLGGTGAVPESLRPLLYDSLGNRSDAAVGTADEFLSRFDRRLEAILTGRTGRVPAPAFPEDAHPDDAGTPFGFLLQTPEAGERHAAPFSSASEEDEGPVCGFAEALFGQAPEEDSAHPLFHPPAGEYDDAAPHGFGLLGQTTPPDDAPARRVDYDEEEDDEAEAGNAGNRLVLWLMVVLIAAVIAGVLAHVSGFAVWQ